EGVVRFIDQRKLPHEDVVVTAHNADEVTAAIRDMIVRGAPAIGISAAYGYVLAHLHNDGESDLSDQIERLAKARPTAVNLLHALKTMQAAYLRLSQAEAPSERMGELLLSEAMGYHEKDIAMNLAMGERGAELLWPYENEATANKLRIVTYCNTGSLATGGHGTALGVIRSLHKLGAVEQIYACETRPYLQGARLTAYEL